MSRNTSVQGTEPPIVVVGSGPAGACAVQTLLSHSPGSSVVLFGKESSRPYDRTRLSSVLAGELDHEALFTEFAAKDDERLVQRYGCEVVEIDRASQSVLDTQGMRQPYSKLILATGSHPYVPRIRGIEQAGVYSYRTISDVEQLLARRVRSRRVVVIGGGALGLEAAKVMRRENTEVYLIEHSMQLMMKELDTQGAELLREYLMSLGIKIILGDSIKEILGDGSVTAVRLRSDRQIVCDTIVVATGIRPNIELAKKAGLPYGRAIRVNDQLQSSDPNIYAIGECAEYRGECYGQVAPGLKQAEIAAKNVLGSSVYYSGSIPATTLTAIGKPVFSMGVVGDDLPGSDYQQIVHEDYSNGIYRKLVLQRGRVVGVMAVGDWQGVEAISRAVRKRKRTWPWQRRRFVQYGDLSA